MMMVAGKSILLVEDNPDHELLTLRALRKNHVANEIKVAHDGAEALEMFFGETGDYAGKRELPQLILLDLKLPKVDGLEVLRRIRESERTRHIPVVVLTSSDEEADIIKSYRLGANSYVRKPIDFPEFVEATKKIGVYWLALNEAAPEQ
jgi:CheY-like chemotaxis protein